MPKIDYESLIVKKPVKSKIKDENAHPRTRYNEPIDKSNNRAHGNSRNWWDANPGVQKKAIDAIVKEAKKQGFTDDKIFLSLGIARLESGFNPDAATKEGSASGLGQFIDSTAKGYDIYDSRDRFDIQ